MAEKVKKANLFDRIGTYFDNRRANGVEGLKLLDECIKRTAQHRDWDALARFVARSSLAGQDAKVKKIIRVAFGDKITYKVDKKHKAGGVFTLGWEGSFPLSGSNTYGVVREAIGNNKSWDDKDFQKKLTEILGPAPKKERIVTEEAEKKVAKHLAKYMAERKAEGFNIGHILDLAQKELKAMQSQAVGVSKTVVNGATVIEINH